MTATTSVAADEFERWDPKTQARAAAALDAALNGNRQAWFCKRGRACDGRPHEGYPYKHARGDQWPPPGSDWFTWLMISGRGAGKTTTGAQWLRKMAHHVPVMAMIGRRGPDVRQTMVEKYRTGLIYACERAGESYEWQPSKKEFTFSNGAVAKGFSAEEPDSLRGPEQGVAWLDEPAHMPLIRDVWSNLLLGMRLDGVPGGAKVLCTSTPLPIPWLKALMKKRSTRVVRVSTHANLENLDPNFRENVVDPLEGTRRGRQELYGEVLEDVEGALWTMSLIENYREDVSYLEMDRIVVGVDPAGTSSKKRDETGIVVVGIKGNHLYVLADYSGHYTPDQWGKKAWEAYDYFHADRIVAEKNYGGEMVLATLRNTRKGMSSAAAELVQSRRGKVLRAEPIVAIYEQHRAHHVSILTELETQMTEWVPGEGDSPDRVDALVHAATALDKTVGEVDIATPEGMFLPQPSGLWVPGPAAW